jgi:cAMP-dependent protein kinase regulator
LLKLNSRIRARLETSFIFTGLDENDIKIVIDAMEEKKFNADDKVIVQGEEGNELFVVDSGTLTCVRQFVTVGIKLKASDEEPRLLRQYQSGEAFGELALLYNAPRAATITANEECILWSLDRETFNNIVKEAAMLMF